MSRSARRVAALTAAVALALAGCDSKPATPATDPESIKKLEELQKQSSQGETPKK
ncbi:MAG: entry exclusion lipoprotein TrbK [Planctomycetes bacterium]|nr:entry exclusion lipoprotein TrbK [Planctomycetota bacterium]